MVPAWVADRVPAESWEPIGGGYSRAPKWRAHLRDGTWAFVKFAEDDELAVRTIAAELAPLGETTRALLRQDQLADLRVALPWAAEQLGLPPS